MACIKYLSMGTQYKYNTKNCVPIAFTGEILERSLSQATLNRP